MLLLINLLHTLLSLSVVNKKKIVNKFIAELINFTWCIYYFYLLKFK